MNPRPIDVVMWTFQSAPTLRVSLESIEASIDDEKICHKIMVDGGSTDETREIGKQFGWDIHLFTEKPIARLERMLAQADHALSLVHTDFYASFEHDIILVPRWLERMEKLMENPKCGVAQGARRSIGNILTASYRSGIPIQGPTFDNTLYRTKLMRQVGYSYHPDVAEAIREAGFTWEIDNDCVSGHLRPSFVYQMKHEILSYRGKEYKWADFSIQRLAFSLFRGIQIAIKNRSPLSIIAHPAYQEFKFLLAIRRQWNSEK
jgi:glycosyltransferase involved in cell wall biosynthesis